MYLPKNKKVKIIVDTTINTVYNKPIKSNKALIQSKHTHFTFATMHKVNQLKSISKKVKKIVDKFTKTVYSKYIQKRHNAH